MTRKIPAPKMKQILVNVSKANHLTCCPSSYTSIIPPKTVKCNLSIFTRSFYYFAVNAVSLNFECKVNKPWCNVSASGIEISKERTYTNIIFYSTFRTHLLRWKKSVVSIMIPVKHIFRFAVLVASCMLSSCDFHPTILNIWCYK